MSCLSVPIICLLLDKNAKLQLEYTLPTFLLLPEKSQENKQKTLKNKQENWLSTEKKQAQVMMGKKT